MSFPGYDHYKDSGVDWLGTVPSHWSVERITNLYREATEAGNDDLPILSVSIHSGVSDDELDPDEVERKVSRSEDRSKYKQVQPNDLVYNMMRAWQGGFGAVRVAGMVSPAYVVARPKSAVPSKYVELLLRTPGAVEEMRRRSRGVTDFRLRLYWDEFKDMRIALPPETERDRIVAFLDRETTKIDALVAEQERLIALLKEKRQAVISYAVTKGLSPDVPMKDSGIEWLGQIPAHWSVCPLSYRYTVALGKMLDEKKITGNFLRPYLRNTDVQWKSINYNDLPEMDFEQHELDRYSIINGDLVVCEGGEVGRAAIWRATETVCYQKALHRLRTRDTENDTTEFLLFFFELYVNLGVFAASEGKSTIAHLPAERLRRYKFVFPPIEEQFEIAEYLTRVSQAWDILEAEAQSAITLLQERRAALISAAVTGKIDVRGVVETSNVVALPTKTSAAALPSSRAVVGAYAIRYLGQMGRMAVMKVGYLAQAHVGVHELAGTYERYAAGPYDGDLINAMQHGAESICGIMTEEPSSKGDVVKYKIPQPLHMPSGMLEAALGPDRTRAFLNLIDLLKGHSREGVEAIATLYAVWNDLIASGRDVTDDAICNGVFDWHLEKREKFSRDTLENWLGWMRRNGVVPDGSAPRTDHQGDLFA
ncbi:MAG: hypothetical protein E2586_20795 [Novosphingobium sp.]|uniref:restriction endonuclease subunit S n=1 Tax=Novosphingobium sp. TaxID=1874826 RepID=UPI0012C14E04|nr:restriction endonuclease subunit S [Novosphingobium sp.]MPS70920.1 hypothetical protein [Novosphingobium sp.]